MRGPVRRALARVHFVIACVAGALSFVGLSLGGLLYVALRPRGSAPVHLARTFHWIMATLLGWRITVTVLKPAKGIPWRANPRGGSPGARESKGIRGRNRCALGQRMMTGFPAGPRQPARREKDLRA